MSRITAGRSCFSACGADPAATGVRAPRRRYGPQADVGVDKSREGKSGASSSRPGRRNAIVANTVSSRSGRRKPSRTYWGPSVPTSSLPITFGCPYRSASVSVYRIAGAQQVIGEVGADEASRSGNNDMNVDTPRVVVITSVSYAAHGLWRSGSVRSPDPTASREGAGQCGALHYAELGQVGLQVWAAAAGSPSRPT